MASLVWSGSPGRNCPLPTACPSESPHEQGRNFIALDGHVVSPLEQTNDPTLFMDAHALNAVQPLAPDLAMPPPQYEREATADDGGH